jgi:hypothetical protein
MACGIALRELQHCNNCVRILSTESGNRNAEKRKISFDLFVNRNKKVVPLQCQRKRRNFLRPFDSKRHPKKGCRAAACLSNKNCLSARHLFPRQSQKRRFFRDKSYYLTI